VRDGEEAVAYLKGEGRYFDREEYPVPDLLLLDLKMPRMDGFEVLRWIRQQPGLSPLRVVMLTSSEDIRDVNVAYRLGANSFMVKPMDFENVVELGKVLRDYWLKMDKAPEISRPPRSQISRPEEDSTGGKS
jgi:CheY-like chemotaxis protein